MLSCWAARVRTGVVGGDHGTCSLPLRVGNSYIVLVLPTKVGPRCALLLVVGKAACGDPQLPPGVEMPPTCFGISQLFMDVSC